MNSNKRHFGFAFIVVILLVSWSCSVSLFPGYHHANSVILWPQSWFTPDTGYYMFNTSIDVLKKHFSGLMIVKPTGKDTSRVIMITEVGLKVLDFEFYPSGEMQVHYIMDPLNKKMLIRTLSNDISMVLMNRIEDEDYTSFIDKRSQQWVLKYRIDGRKNFYYFNPRSSFPAYAKQVKGITNKVHARFYGNEQTGPDSVIIEHDNIALSVNLRRIQEISHADE